MYYVRPSAVDIRFLSSQYLRSYSSSYGAITTDYMLRLNDDTKLTDRN